MKSNFGFYLLGHIFDAKFRSICSGGFFEILSKKKFQKIPFEVKILENLNFLKNYF